MERNQEQIRKLRLSKQERRDIELIDDASESQLLTILRANIWDNNKVIKYSLFSERFDQLCKCEDPVIMQRWLDAWALQAPKNAPPFAPIDTIPTFTLLQGSWCYNEFRRFRTASRREVSPSAKQKSDDQARNSAKYHAKVFLEWAVKLNNFTAIKFKCYSLLKRSEPKDTSDHVEIIQLADQACQYYGTPGYLLQCHLLNECALSIQHEYPRLCLQYLTLAYKMIFLAEQSYNSSQAAINIAYLGESLLDHYQFESWQAGKDFFANSIRCLNGNPSDIERNLDAELSFTK